MEREALELLDDICLKFGVDKNEVLNKGKGFVLDQARALFCYMVKRYHNPTYEEVDAMLNRNRNTCFTLKKQAEIMVRSDKFVRQKFLEIRRDRYPYKHELPGWQKIQVIMDGDLRHPVFT